MAIIDPSSDIVNEDSCTFWNDELINLKILLNKIDAGILYLAGSNHQEYSLDTGQSNQRVKRLSLDELNTMRTALLSDIQDLELKLGQGKSGVIIVQPCF